jgi:hypothetical protein
MAVGKIKTINVPKKSCVNRWLMLSALFKQAAILQYQDRPYFQTIRNQTQ